MYINTKGIFNENNYDDLFIKGGEVDKLWQIFEKIEEKNLIEVTGTTAAQFLKVFRVIYQKLCFSVPVICLQFSKKCARVF